MTLSNTQVRLEMTQAQRLLHSHQKFHIIVQGVQG